MKDYTIAKTEVIKALIAASIIQMSLTIYIFLDVFGNDVVQSNKFRYFVYTSFLALQFYPIFLLVVLIFKIIVYYLKKMFKNEK